MRVYVSYASSDEKLAERVAGFLRQEGLEVWDGTEILPGDNWASKVAEALQEADAMVVLLTPDAVRSRHVNAEIAYALGKREFSGGLVPVLAVPAEQLSRDEIPWILNKLPMVQLSDHRQEEDGFREIAAVLQNRAQKVF